MTATSAGAAGPRRCKVVFVGDPEVGKTSVICRYVYVTFQETYQNTIGIDFLSKSIRVQDAQVRLQLWDTAGQERFRSLIPSYIRDASAVVVVYDVANRGSFDNVGSWIQNVRDQKGDDAVILLLGNKSDLEDSRQVPTEEGERAAQAAKVLFQEASAKTGDNIDPLFTYLVESLPAPPGDAGTPSELQGRKLSKQAQESAAKSCAC